jgi:hypothetical protein
LLACKECNQRVKSSRNLVCAIIPFFFIPLTELTASAAGA